MILFPLTAETKELLRLIDLIFLISLFVSPLIIGISLKLARLRFSKRLERSAICHK